MDNTKDAKNSVDYFSTYTTGGKLQKYDSLEHVGIVQRNIAESHPCALLVRLQCIYYTDSVIQQRALLPRFSPHV